ncbi:electron transfer flavoprotein subunit beta/FixA family protein [Propioniferax innocua]|uniref:Electron transfer flavoprotein subunit beta n=1 Tax=Propioniferax innocua TaxID=1753 RepID=A0A542ZQ55_9ACTN|nr:electron transfer flavoprotein subunit beta/FixA family protein [Propioniferax innocua]TQL62485.1 electron transfer flavoprotein beta subunit [Propioniferax innocua]
MKIVTLVKYVPDATGDREFADDNTVDRDAADGLLSELDEYAVEQALQIKEAGDDVEVVALTMGDDDASDAIKKALQMGADAGIHVCDDDIHGSDAMVTSKILAAAIEKIGPDLVVTGMSSTDGGMGVMGAMLAERLGWAQVTMGSEVSVDGGTVKLKRDTDTSTQHIEAALPAIVSVTDQSGEARYPSMKNIMAAKKKKVDEWDLDDLDLEDAGMEASYTQVTETNERPPKEAGRVVTDEDGSGAAELVEFLSAGKYL